MTGRYADRGPATLTRSERFWRKVRPAPGMDCWLWTASVDDKGYGQFHDPGQSSRAHRFAWVELRGEIPDGLVTDHLCHVPSCVNPWHFDLVPMPVNSGRNTHAMKLGCEKGHLFTEANTYWHGGHRKCRICNRINVARFHARARARRAAEQELAA